jgi:death-on-curing protein
MSELGCVDVDAVIQINQLFTKDADSLVDRLALQSAVSRQWMGVGETALYPDLAGKAGALLHGIVQNHPFVDGNKRTALAAADALCDMHGYRLHGTPDELIELALTATTSPVEDVISAVREMLRPLE